MTRGWWPWRLRGVLGRTRHVSALAALTMMLFAGATLEAAAPEGAGLPDWPAKGQAPAGARTGDTPGAGGRGPLNPDLPPSVNYSLDALARENVLGPIIVILLFVTFVLALVLYLRRDAMDKALRARDKAHAEALAERERITDAARDEWLAELSQLQESRLALLERVMTVAGNATAVIQMHAASTNERTASAEKLTDTLRDFIATASASRTTFLGIAEELQRQGRANSEALTKLSQRGGPSL
jgi:hypothetical protein